jgi:predicted HTH domain antitoxin
VQTYVDLAHVGGRDAEAAEAILKPRPEPVSSATRHESWTARRRRMRRPTDRGGPPIADEVSHESGGPCSQSASGCKIADRNTNMAPVQVELDADVVALLEEINRPAKQAARELIVLELYREGVVSSGKAAELMALPRDAFIRRAGALGIPYFQITNEELRRELGESELL